jgi:membrane-bound lytic murein transglycosylase MltF
MAYFQAYGERYGFDWTLLAAQAYQESGIDQSRRSHTGAVGVMQVLRSTAADRNVAIAGIEQLENNIHAGVKYLRFITDRYLADENITEFNRILLALAGYNVGPGRLARLREEAKKAAKDPNAWFDNVEIIAARRVGREPVQYVSNILKYWVSYQLLMDREPLLSLVEPEPAPPSAPCRCGVESGECPRCRG